MTDSTYALVIPAVDSNSKCKGFLDNLLTSIQWGRYEAPVIICWDNCGEEFINYFKKKYAFISLPYNGENNLNFCKNANRGIRYAYEELSLGVFLINLDVVLPHYQHLEKVRNSGLASPRAQHFDGEVVQKFYNLNKVNDPGCPCNKNNSGPKLTPTNKFAAFCMWMSKYALGQIGYLDEYTYISSFEDDDIIIRASLAGLPVEQSDVIVHHELKNREVQISTTGAYDLEMLGDHMLRFMQKWKVPPGTSHEKFPEYIISNWKGDPPLEVR